MPLAPNSLLQAAPAVKPQASSVNAQAVAVDARAKAPGFAQVFAKESSVAPAKATDRATGWHQQKHSCAVTGCKARPKAD